MPSRRKQAGPQGIPPSVAITEHPIRHEDIHPNVHFLCQRMHEQGYRTLLVGGAVRDLLLGRVPKDFDLATSARPEVVKRLFRNARIIGRRFRLAQLRYPNMSVEVATFRGESHDKQRGMIRRDNRYGTAEEDARRRDFTVNALTLDPLTMTLYDYVGAMADLKVRRIRTIKPPQDSFLEDPVRMLRAVRFKVRLGFELEPGCEAAIPKMAHHLLEVKRHRLAEETQRFLTRGNALAMYREFDRLHLLRPLLHLEPYRWFFDEKALQAPFPHLEPFLTRMDQWVEQGGETIQPTVALLGLLVTLARGEFRTLMGGGNGNGRNAHAALHDHRLITMLADWGMLNGQVKPALAILEAASGLAGGRSRPWESGGAQLPPTGIREAWLLLIILRNVLDVPAVLVEQGVGQLPQLPDLPILDHPRPLGRGHAQVSSRGPGHKVPQPRIGKRHRKRRKRSAPGERQALPPA